MRMLILARNAQCATDFLLLWIHCRKTVLIQLVDCIARAQLLLSSLHAWYILKCWNSAAPSVLMGWNSWNSAPNHHSTLTIQLELPHQQIPIVTSQNHPPKFSLSHTKHQNQCILLIGRSKHLLKKFHRLFQLLYVAKNGLRHCQNHRNMEQTWNTKSCRHTASLIYKHPSLQPLSTRHFRFLIMVIALILKLEEFLKDPPTFPKHSITELPLFAIAQLNLFMKVPLDQLRLVLIESQSYHHLEPSRNALGCSPE